MTIIIAVMTVIIMQLGAAKEEWQLRVSKLPPISKIFSIKAGIHMYIHTKIYNAYMYVLDIRCIGDFYNIITGIEIFKSTLIQLL